MEFIHNNAHRQCMHASMYVCVLQQYSMHANEVALVTEGETETN